MGYSSQMVRNQIDPGQPDANGKVCISASPNLTRQVPENDLRGYSGLVHADMAAIQKLASEEKALQWELRHLHCGPEGSHNDIDVVDGRGGLSDRIFLMDTARISGHLGRSLVELKKAQSNLARVFKQYMWEVENHIKESQSMLNGEDEENSWGSWFWQFARYTFLGM
jgi:hypothetical protein